MEGIMTDKEREDVVQEVANLRKDLAELKDSVEEIVTLFKEGKSVIKFFSAVGKVAKWAAIMAVAVTAIWSAVTSLLTTLINAPKH